MHKSQLAGFIIDCQDADLDAAANFWSQALGFARRPSKAEEDHGYALLDTPPTCITSRPTPRLNHSEAWSCQPKTRRSLETGVNASLADGVWALMRVPWQCGALQRKEDIGHARSGA